MFCKLDLMLCESVSVWDWSWQLRDCELHRLGHIDRIVASLHRKKKCVLLSLHKGWLTKHTNYTRSCKGLPALVDWSGLTFSLSQICIDALWIHLNDSQIFLFLSVKFLIFFSFLQINFNVSQSFLMCCRSFLILCELSSMFCKYL